jgi:hypothetical protein
VLPFLTSFYGDCGTKFPKTAISPALSSVYDAAGNVIETYEHKGDFKEWLVAIYVRDARSIIREQRG